MSASRTALRLALGVFVSLLAAPAFSGPGAMGAWTLLALISTTVGVCLGPVELAEATEPRLPAWVFAAWRVTQRADPAAPVLRLRSAEDEAELRRQARLLAGLVPQD